MRSLARLVGALVLALAAPPVAAQDMVGALSEHVTVESDTLPDIAVAYGVGFTELVAANPGVDPWLPGAGVHLTLPTAHLLPATSRRGIIINLAELRLYSLRPGKPAESFPIGIGSDGIDIPFGQSHVVRKQANPTWIPPASVLAENPDLPRAVPPGPDNPLGHFALYLAWPRVVIHGTNRPYGVGRRVSHGCFRMFPQHIEHVYGETAAGTTVTVVDQPIKAGWQDGQLYLEVHLTLNEATDLDVLGYVRTWETRDPRPILLEKAGDQADRIDWTLVHTLTAARLGIPVRVTR